MLSSCCFLHSIFVVVVAVVVLCVSTDTWKQSINLYFVPSCQSDTVSARNPKQECCSVANKHRKLAFWTKSFIPIGSHSLNKLSKNKILFLYIQLFSISLNCCDACASVSTHPVSYVRFLFYITDFDFHSRHQDAMRVCVCIYPQTSRTHQLFNNKTERKNE